MDSKTLMEKVGAHWAGDDLQRQFQQEVAALLHRNNHRAFPGAQPVSFSMQHIGELKRRDYYVCEKTDGIRYLIYLTDDGAGNPCHYLIDRKNDYYYVANLFFPHHEANPNFDKFHVDTILDGELVEDRYADGSSELKFLVFDLLVIDKKDMRIRPLDKRLAYVKQYILAPYKAMLKQDPRRRGAFLVDDKRNEFSYALPTMFHEIIPQVKQLHGNDGLIFTCKDTPYVSGTDVHILKWKPPEENTVDFLMHIVWTTLDPEPEDPDQAPYEDFDALPQELELYIYHGNDGDYEKIGDLFVTQEEWESMKKLGKPIQNMIVECFLEDTNALNGMQMNGDGANQKRWRFHRFRDDKHDANHVSTFNSVIESIKDHVTQDDLLQYADDIRTTWKSRHGKEGEVQRQGSRI